MAEYNTTRMRQLIETLNNASDAYYNGKGELMTDYEWDAAFDELKALEEMTGITLPDSPTTKVSADDTSGQKEEHEFAALSLAKTKQPEELAKWAEGRKIWMSWKLDGLTLVVTYDDGKLTKVVTRGNGHVGTNITRLASAIMGIPAKIAYEGHLVIRGEAVISYKDFEQFLMEQDEDYANPRNLASGSLTLKDIDKVSRRKIQWIAFTLVYADKEINSWGERMDFLQSQGFNTVDHQCIDVPTLANIEIAINKWTEKVTNGTNPYPVDGLVIAYDDTAYAATGSVTGHHATRAGYAFKWQDESVVTKLDHIEWSCAASTISPVAVFEPVELEGTTVKRASLCNISECQRLDIGDKGTEISVIKANKIIPKVIKVENKVGELHIPTECPVCGSPTEVVTSASSGTLTLHCTNAECPAKKLKKFARFVSKDGINIDGMSEQTIARFVNLGWISEYADFFDLEIHALEMSMLDGFGQKSTQKLLAAIDKARNVDARKLLYALNIPLCGSDVCKRLLGQYPIAVLMEKARLEADDYFAHIPGIGPEKSASICRWAKDDDNYNIYTRLIEKLDISENDSNAEIGTRCQGLTFVVTGDVHHFKNRNELKAYIESQGGKVTGSVSKSTSFLINNDVTSTSGKNKKAQELGISIISEDDFIAQYKE